MKNLYEIIANVRIENGIVQCELGPMSEKYINSGECLIADYMMTIIECTKPKKKLAINTLAKSQLRIVLEGTDGILKLQVYPDNSIYSCQPLTHNHILYEVKQVISNRNVSAGLH